MDAVPNAPSTLYTPRKASAPFALTLRCAGQLATPDDLHRFWSGPLGPHRGRADQTQPSIERATSLTTALG